MTDKKQEIASIGLVLEKDNSLDWAGDFLLRFDIARYTIVHKFVFYYQLIQFRCKCGRCSLEELSNAKECKCCTEIESCMVAINDAEVVEEVGSVVSCVTEHPGFSAVCLNKWSLRLAADKYKTRHGRRYRRAGFENE